MAKLDTTTKCSQCGDAVSDDNIDHWTWRVVINANSDRFSIRKECRSYRNKINETYSAGLSSKYAKIKSRAKSKKIKFELSISDYTMLVKENKCYYCQDPLPRSGYGIDRKDPNKGYILENSVACCIKCNQGKNDCFTDKEWKTMINAYKQLKKENN